MINWYADTSISTYRSILTLKICYLVTYYWVSHKYSTNYWSCTHHSLDERVRRELNWELNLNWLIRHILNVHKYTVCPKSSDPLYIVTYCIKWVTTSWTHSSISSTHIQCTKRDVQKDNILLPSGRSEINLSFVAAVIVWLSLQQGCGSGFSGRNPHLKTNYSESG